MIDLILHQIDNTHVITIDLQLTIFDPQIIEQPFKLNALFIAFIMAIYSASTIDKEIVDYKVQ